MKFNYLAACALVLATAWSCQDNNKPDDEGGKEPEVKTITVSLDAFNTKASLNGNAMVWDEADEIGCVDAELVKVSKWALKEGAGTAQGVFESEGVSPADVCHAFYPVSIARNASASADGIVVTLEVPGTQEYTAAGLPVKNPMYGAIADGKAKLSSIFGYMRLLVKGDEPVNKMVLTANGGEPLAGIVDCTIAGGRVSATAGDINELTIDCSAAPVELTEAGTIVTVAVLPGTYAEGLFLKCYNGTRLVGERELTSSVTVNSGAITNVDQFAEYVDPEKWERVSTMFNCDEVHFVAASLDTEDKMEGSACNTAVGGGTNVFQTAGAGQEVPFTFDSEIVDFAGAALRFWYWIEDIEKVKPTAENGGQVEITSEGSYDKREFGWNFKRFEDKYGMEPLKTGWNLVTLPLNMAELRTSPNPFGACNLHAINYFRIHHHTYGDCLFKIDDIHFVKLKEAYRRNVVLVADCSTLDNWDAPGIPADEWKNNFRLHKLAYYAQDGGLQVKSYTGVRDLIINHTNPEPLDLHITNINKAYLNIYVLNLDHGNASKDGTIELGSDKDNYYVWNIADYIGQKKIDNSHLDLYEFPLKDAQKVGNPDLGRVAWFSLKTGVAPVAGKEDPNEMYPNLRLTLHIDYIHVYQADRM